MATQLKTHEPPLTTGVRALLTGLRWRIRAYVWLQGLSLAMIWLVAAFWVGLAIDYLPILVGASETPWQARGVFLASNAIVLAWILYRWILRRAFVPLADHSMALLLERRFDRFDDALVTAVEMHEHPDHAATFNPAMLARTSDAAAERIGGVHLGQVLNRGPLVAQTGIAAVLIATVGLFAAVDFDMLRLATSRLFALDTQPWPRSAHIEVAAVEIAGDESASAGPTLRRLTFDNRSVKVARGSNVGLLVQADTHAPKTPEHCTIYYVTGEGDRGRVNMKAIGHIRDGRQEYKFDGKPLQGILSSLEFDVVGYDHRVRDYRIEVVDSPTVAETQLDLVFPPYLSRSGEPEWLPRSEPFRSGIQLPQGVSLTARVRTNKELISASVKNAETGEEIGLSINRSLLIADEHGSQPQSVSVILPADEAIDLPFDGSPLRLQRPGGGPLNVQVERTARAVDAQTGEPLLLESVYLQGVESAEEVSLDSFFGAQAANAELLENLEVADAKTGAVVRLASGQPVSVVDARTGKEISVIVGDFVYLVDPSGQSTPLENNLTVDIVNSEGSRSLAIGILRRRADFPSGLQFRLDDLPETVAVEIVLRDVDNVDSERPHRLVFGVVEDQPPAVQSRLQGVGLAITPDARVPVRGEISDDYGVARAWIQMERNDDSPRERDVELAVSGAVEAEIDFRELRAEDGGVELQPEDKVVLTLRAVDHFDLTGAANQGAGERYVLDVVTPNQLLSILERREFEQRRRFEHVIDELTEMRDSLLRVKTETSVDEPQGAEPEDSRNEADGPDQVSPAERAARRAQALRLLRSQRALLQGQKSAGETHGIALSFLDIREELINNRVDTPEREQRLKEQIADPLLLVCENLFPDLEARIKKLVDVLEPQDSTLESGVAEADSAVQLTSQILTELDQVLQRMLELEDYNDLLDIVRQLIKDQEQLIESTKDVRRSGLRDL